MEEKMRDLLEEQIIADAKDGDTTVLASLLEMLDNKVIFNALSDKNQLLINKAKNSPPVK